MIRRVKIMQASTVFCLVQLTLRRYLIKVLNHNQFRPDLVRNVADSFNNLNALRVILDEARTSGALSLCRRNNTHIQLAIKPRSHRSSARTA